MVKKRDNTMTRRQKETQARFSHPKNRCSFKPMPTSPSWCHLILACLAIIFCDHSHANANDIASRDTTSSDIATSDPATRPPFPTGRGLDIVVSIPPLQYIVLAIAPKATVTVLFPTEKALERGTMNGHLIKAIHFADIVFTTPNAKERQVVKSAMKGIRHTPLAILNHATNADQGWLVPSNATMYAEQIAAALAALSNEEAKMMAQNAETLVTTFNGWDKSFSSLTKAVKQPVFSVHSSLEGIHARYGIQIQPYENSDNETGPSHHELWLSKAHHWHPCCILVPQSSASMLGHQLAQQTGAAVMFWDPMTKNLNQTYRTLETLLEAMRQNPNG